MYKYIHDQSLQLLNAGYTMAEIGEMVHLPPGPPTQRGCGRCEHYTSGRASIRPLRAASANAL